MRAVPCQVPMLGCLAPPGRPRGGRGAWRRGRLQRPVGRELAEVRWRTTAARRPQRPPRGARKGPRRPRSPRRGEGGLVRRATSARTAVLSLRPLRASRGAGRRDAHRHALEPKRQITTTSGAAVVPQVALPEVEVDAGAAGAAWPAEALSLARLPCSASDRCLNPPRLLGWVAAAGARPRPSPIPRAPPPPPEGSGNRLCAAHGLPLPRAQQWAAGGSRRGATGGSVCRQAGRQAC